MKRCRRLALRRSEQKMKTKEALQGKALCSNNIHGKIKKICDCKNGMEYKERPISEMDLW